VIFIKLGCIVRPNCMGNHSAADNICLHYKKNLNF